MQAGGGRFVGGTLDSGADTIPGVFVEMDLQGDNAVGNLGEIFATNLLFRNTAPLTIPAGVTVQASTLRIDVDGGDLTVDGTVIAAIGPFAATLRASGDIIVPEGGRVEGDGLRLIAGFDFASGAPDAAAAAALRLSGTIRGAFSDGDFNDVELIAGAGGILLTGAQLEGLNLDLVAGSGGIEQSGGRIFISEQLRVTTPGDATLAVTPGAALDGNRIGSLGPSDVGGDFSLTALGAVGGLDLSGDIRVAGTLTLRSRGGRISQDEGSRLLLGALDATTPGGIGLGGDNEIALVQLLVGGAFNDSVRLRNLTSLELAGTVTAEQGAVSIDVVGGDLLVSGLVSAGQDVTLRASGNTTLAAGGLVRADGNGALALVGGFNPVTGVADLAGGLVLAGTLGDAAGTNTLFLGAGTGGIQQTGGRLVGQGFGLASGGDAILDRGGDQAGARNAISGSLGSITIPGDFVLDNGNTPILLSGSTITAASIGLRTGVALSLAEPGCFPACASAPAGLQAGAGRVSLRVGELSVVTGAVIRGGLVEVAPAVPSDMAVLFPAPEAGSLNLTPTGFAAIEATALRLGATTFRGVTETTASSLRLGGPLALDIPLDLRSLGGVMQAADADLAVSRLTGRVDGPVTLTNPGNRIGTLGDFEAAAGLALRSTGALLLDGLVQAPGFTLALNVLGAVTQSPDAGITAGALSGGATGGAVLEGTNQLTAIAGFDAGSGDFRLNNTAPLLELPVGTSLVAAGEVAVTNSGDLAVDGTIAAAGITLAAGDIGLGGVLEAVNTVSLTGDIIEAFGTGRIDAALLVLNASADVTLEGANQVTALGPSSLGGSLAFANSGDLLLAGSLDAAGQIVALEVTGTLTQAPGTGITAAALEGQATAGATLEGTNQLAAIASFDGGTGDFRLNNTAPLLELPAGGRLETGGTLAITQAGDLLIDGTAIGAETILDATGLLTVNGFSAIARGGDLLLRGDRVTVAGLTAALGEIGVEAADTANLGGIAIGRLLRVAAPTIRFATLDATATPVLLQLGGGGRATGSLDALALEVSGGAGAVLTGSIAGIVGQPAAAEGLRSSAIGTPLPDPPAPTAFLFNGCPIGVPLCGAVPPAPPEASPGEPGGPAVPSAPEGSPDIPISSAPPETEVVTLPGGAITAANNPAPLIEALDPAALAAAVTQTRPSVPNVTSSFARDRTEAEDLAPPNIRGGDF